jgi:hypothetical protein
MAVAALSASVLKPDLERSGRVYPAADEWLSISDSEFEASLNEIQESLAGILDLFGFPAGEAGKILADVAAGAESTRQEGRGDGET